MTITTEELLHALRHDEVKLINCSDCHATGTKFNGNGKSSTCPRCKGKRKLVSIPRAPHEEPVSAEWDAYFNKPKHRKEK